MRPERSVLASRFDAANEGSPEQLAELLGGKGAGLAAMTVMGLPVPPGFTLTTDACRLYAEEGWTDALDTTLRQEIAVLERTTGKRLGGAVAPLVLSVRSGAAHSMPGMMDTVLDVGMNDDAEAGLATASGDPAFAADTHRRGLLSFAEVVAGASASVATFPTSTPVSDVRSMLAAAGVVVPEDPIDQVIASVRAVFGSWWSDRARSYRSVEGIDDDLGTAATVQAMVFGNLGADSGTGVAFTRDPSSGEPGLMGDFLTAAQGEDVVSGRHQTRPISEMADLWPDAYQELCRVADRLEQHHADMVDIEFTVERGRLWLLQTRPGKRSAVAALRIAVDLADDPTFPVDRGEAVRRCRRHLDDPPTIADEPEGGATDDSTSDSEHPVVAHGLAAAPGSASGVLCTDVDEAVALAERGVDIVLVRRETSPSDVAGMVAAVGLVTTLGGLVSHAAVVARSWGLPAVVGASDLELVDGGVVGPGGRVDAGALVTVDGDRGRLVLGARATRRAEPPEVATLRTWAQELDRAPSSAVDRAPGSRGDHAGPSEAGPTYTDHRFLTLHAVRIKGMATVDTLAAMTGLGPLALRAQLEPLVEAGDVSFVPNRGLYRITKTGRSAHAEALARAVAGLDLRSLGYDDFLDLNASVKALCTDWQMRGGEPNDHSDAEYDAQIIDRLCQIDDVAQTVVRSFGSAVPWTERYGPRLGDARRRVVDGDATALTGVMCDSYHDVWMELHEDLILTQGIDRAVEGST